MAESAAGPTRPKEAAGARPASQGAQLGALAQAQLSGVLRLVSAEAAQDIERFADPQLAAAGKITIMSLETIQQRFGDGWQSRKGQVFDFTEQVLQRSLGPRGVHLRVSDSDYFIIHPALGRLAGQAACLRYLREILNHFLGDANQAAKGVLQVNRVNGGRLEASEVDALRAEAAVAAGEDDDDPDGPSWPHFRRRKAISPPGSLTAGRRS